MGEKDDLTRLEDLSEYIHQLDEEVDSQLDDGSKSSETPPPPPPPVGLDDLDDNDDNKDNNQSKIEQESEPSEQATEDETPDFSLDDFASDEFSNEDSFEGDDFNESSFEESDDFGGDDFSTDDFSSEDNDSFSNPTEPDFQLNSGDFESTAQFDQNDNDSEQQHDDFNYGDDSESDNFSENITVEQNDPDNEEEALNNDETQSFTEMEQESEEEELEADSNSDDQEEITPTPLTTEISQETFKDVRSFAQHISYGQVTRGGNPPFTLLIRNINFFDDVEDIKIILKEYGLYTEDNASLIDQSLQQGALILPQLSEFAAIFLANKLRRFSGDIQLGFSDEIHPSKGINKNFKGLVSKENLLRNMKRSKKAYREDFDKDSIILATTPTVEKFNIKEYLGVLSSDVTVPEKFFHEQALEESSEQTVEELTERQQLMHDFLSQFTIGTTAYYQDLAEDLRNKAYKSGANGVIGITYTITPLVNFQNGSSNGHYKILATGSAVVLEARSEG